MTTDPLHDTRWDVIPYAPHPAHMHMALDEVLLGEVIGGRRGPTMRMWRWIDSALVIGSHQSVANEVDLDTASKYGFVVTRRMSGGGTMLCEPGGTITYSLYLPEEAVAGLTIRQAAASHDTLVAVTVAVIAGALLLFPSLTLLFRLALGGSLGATEKSNASLALPQTIMQSAAGAGIGARLAGALLLAGVGLLTIADAGWAHAVGVLSLLAFIVVGFLSATPAQLAAQEPAEHEASRATDGD